MEVLVLLLAALLPLPAGGAATRQAPPTTGEHSAKMTDNTRKDVFVSLYCGGD